MLSLTPLLLLFGAAAPSQADSASPQNSPAQVRTDWGLAESARQLLIQRCGDCHGSDSTDRKAKRAWPDAGDLAATVEEFVTAGKPAASDLYYLIEDGEMPPEDSDVAAPTEQEMQLLHAWITGGAQLPKGLPEPSEVKPDEQPATAKHYVSRSHPLWIHFPLALIPVALLASFLARLTRKTSLDTTALFCVVLAVPTALMAAASGWLHASELGSTEGMNLHRWLGVATAGSAMLALLVRKRPGLFLLVLAISSGLGAAAGHFGGRITYGENFFPW